MVDKLESRSKVCQFVGYPKGTRGYYFYSQVDQKVFVSTNARFLEDDYMVSNNVKSKVILRYLDKTPITSQDTMDLIPTIPNSSTPIPRHSGRVVKQPNRFMYLGESFKAIPEEQEIDPTDYDEAMNDLDAHLWQKAMEVEIESMYFNQV